MSTREFAIEMDGSNPQRYGIVHVMGCRDLRDPEPLGPDWVTGVAGLGTDWEDDVAEGLIRVAPCAR